MVRSSVQCIAWDLAQQRMAALDRSLPMPYETSPVPETAAVIGKRQEPARRKGSRGKILPLTTITSAGNVKKRAVYMRYIHSSSPPPYG